MAGAAATAIVPAFDQGEQMVRYIGYAARGAAVAILFIVAASNAHTFGNKRTLGY